MNALVDTPPQIKFVVEPEFKDRVTDALERQGTNIKMGVTRILEMFMAQDRSVRALMLKQIEGDDAREFARIILARMAAEDVLGGEMGGQTTGGAAGVKPKKPAGKSGKPH